MCHFDHAALGNVEIQNWMIFQAGYPSSSFKTVAQNLRGFQIISKSRSCMTSNRFRFACMYQQTVQRLHYYLTSSRYQSIDYIDHYSKQTTIRCVETILGDMNSTKYATQIVKLIFLLLLRFHARTDIDGPGIRQLMRLLGAQRVWREDLMRRVSPQISVLERVHSLYCYQDVWDDCDNPGRCSSQNTGRIANGTYRY